MSMITLRLYACFVVHIHDWNWNCVCDGWMEMEKPKRLTVMISLTVKSVEVLGFWFLINFSGSFCTGFTKNKKKQRSYIPRSSGDNLLL